MSVTYGFYNAKNHDRRYNSIQISSIFDGIISDGIYMSIGDHMVVKPDTGMMVTVGVGRAWFNHTWTLNDSLLPIKIPLSEIILNRIDAVVLEVNAEEHIRANDIKVIKGKPGTYPERPSMIKTSTVHQYPLAYIYIKAGTEEIRYADITNMVGTSDTPFVTGIIDTINIDDLIAQWGDQWQKYYAEKVSEIEHYLSELETTGNSQLKEIVEAMKNYESVSEKQWEEWFDDIRQTLASVENGEMLEQLLMLIRNLYNMANQTDIDRILNESYIDIEDTEGIFEIATTSDIDDIIGGIYVDQEEATTADINSIIAETFEQRGE